MGARARTTIYDEDTGLVTFERERALKRYWHDEKGYRWRDSANALRMFEDLDAPDSVSDADFRRLCKLRRHTWLDSQMLGRGFAGGVQPYTAVQIGRAIGLSERQAFRFLARMQREGMVVRVRALEVQYYLNPIYFCCCRWVSANLYLLFRKEFDRLLPEWVRIRFMEIEPEPPKVVKRARRKPRRRISVR